MCFKNSLCLMVNRDESRLCETSDCIRKTGGETIPGIQVEDSAGWDLTWRECRRVSCWTDCERQGRTRGSFVTMAPVTKGLLWNKLTWELELLGGGSLMWGRLHPGLEGGEEKKGLWIQRKGGVPRSLGAKDRFTFSLAVPDTGYRRGFKDVG